MDGSGNSKISGIEDLIGAWDSQGGFGMDSGLGDEGVETGNVVVGQNIDLNGLCNKVFRGHGASDMGALDKPSRHEFCIKRYLTKLVLAGHLLAISNAHSSPKYS